MTAPETIWEMLNTEIVKSVAGSLAGAFFGAWGAHRLAERARIRQEITKEVRDSVRAATISYQIAEAFISVKKQNIKPLYDSFVAGREAFIAFEATKQPGLEFDYHRNLPVLMPVAAPVSDLRSFVLDRVSASARAITFVEVLHRSVEAYNGLIIARNEFVEQLKEQKPNPFVYFGVELNGYTDETYFSLLKAAFEYTDNCIYFGKALADDLVLHISTLRSKLPKRARDALETIRAVNFDKVADIMPDPNLFKDYDTMFVKAAKGRTSLGFWDTTDPREMV